MAATAGDRQRCRSRSLSLERASVPPPRYLDCPGLGVESKRSRRSLGGLHLGQGAMDIVPDASSASQISKRSSADFRNDRWGRRTAATGREVRRPAPLGRQHPRQGSTAATGNCACSSRSACGTSVALPLPAFARSYLRNGFIDVRCCLSEFVPAQAADLTTHQTRETPTAHDRACAGFPRL